MLVPHIQQSATNNHKRIDIGAWHSGHAQESTSPLSHKPAVKSLSLAAAAVFAGAPDSSAGEVERSPGATAPPETGSTISKLESCSAVLMTRRVSGLAPSANVPVV
jgi:hypothetical protein